MNICSFLPCLPRHEKKKLLRRISRKPLPFLHPPATFFRPRPPSSIEPLRTSILSTVQHSFTKRETREGGKRTSFRNGRMYRSIRKSKDSVRIYIYISGRMYEGKDVQSCLYASQHSIKIRFFSTLIIAVYDTHDNGARNRNAIQFIHSRGTVFLWIPEKGETRVT